MLLVFLSIEETPNFCGALVKFINRVVSYLCSFPSWQKKCENFVDFSWADLLDVLCLAPSTFEVSADWESHLQSHAESLARSSAVFVSF